MSQDKIKQDLYQLYDQYCHDDIDRRTFFRKAATLGAGGASALLMAQSLLPDYALAETISFNDDRILGRYVDYESPGGTSERMRGYLVTPTQQPDTPKPAILVVHENRGLNPYVEDVARRCAAVGYVALAPDGLTSVGGYPGNDDDGRALQRGLDKAALKQDMLNSAYYLKQLSQTTDRLGVVGFCWGGGISNFLATAMGDELHAAVPYYGRPPELTEVAGIKAALMIQAAEHDPRINALWPDYQAALKAADIPHQYHFYPGVQHGFHNNSTPRYDEAAADLSWQRTLAFFAEHLF